jgi:hypothetical protein
MNGVCFGAKFLASPFGPSSNNQMTVVLHVCEIGDRTFNRPRRGRMHGLLWSMSQRGDDVFDDPLRQRRDCQERINFERGPDDRNDKDEVRMKKAIA